MGHNDYGGNCTSVQTQINGQVETIYSTSTLFCAKLYDGSIVMWGV